MLKLKNTLLFRLTLLYAVAFIFLSGITFLVFYYHLYSVTMDGLKGELLEKVEWYSAKMAKKGLSETKAALAREAEAEDPHEEFFRLFTSSGAIVFSTNLGSWGNIEQHAILTKLPDSATGYILQKYSIPDRNFEALIISAIIGPDTVLQIGESFKDTEEYLAVFRNLFFVLLCILILASAAIGWFVARRALSDMQQVTQTAAEISEGDYDKRVRLEGRLEEIKQLGGAFNHMLDRIQALLASMKEINDNIAHDLRSPLARIRGIAEMTLLGDKPIEDYKNMAVSTMEECDSLIEMINTMLDITEAEAGVNGTKIEEFDLVRLTTDACAFFQPLAEEKQIELKIELPEALSFRGARKKMQRIVTNLLENAIKYTPAGGTVTVMAAARGDSVEIIFRDKGIGIAETDLPHIFERFYRGDRSRAGSGVGLGLSLVKAYTESMSGIIRVESCIHRGSTFTVSFVQKSI